MGRWKVNRSWVVVEWFIRRERGERRGGRKDSPKKVDAIPHRCEDYFTLRGGRSIKDSSDCGLSLRFS